MHDFTLVVLERIALLIFQHCIVIFQYLLVCDQDATTRAALFPQARRGRMLGR
jgi:hypothetical protein